MLVSLNRGNGSGNQGTGAAPSADAFEVEMDMELILGIAPKLAALNVYEAPNSRKGSLDMWAQIINNDSVPVISTSWGLCENDMDPAEIDAENNLFLIAAAQGQTILASSGDAGTNDCLSYYHQDANFLAVNDPASQPYVTGVGGTTLALNGDNTYLSETVWNNYYQPDDGGATGGGISSHWGMLSWQQGPGVSNSYSSGTPCAASSGDCREVPDVAFDADPHSGPIIYCTVTATGCSSSAPWWFGGGTSAGSPMWAAFVALTNEKTLHDGGFNIGFLNPFLYQIDQNAGNTSYSNDFHDITVGDKYYVVLC